jgi:transposase InsO family protein
MAAVSSWRRLKPPEPTTTFASLSCRAVVPKLNGGVERAHRTHREELYECCWTEPPVTGYQPALAEWITVCNTIRPHQALDYQTPAAWLAQWRAAHPPQEIAS